MREEKAFGDREMLADALLGQKQLTGSYNVCANECASPALMSEVMNILNEEHQIQHELFDEMTKRGWYTAEPASPARLAQCKARFTQD